jgi:hypothetical protein
MTLTRIAEHATVVAGETVTFGVILGYGPDAALRLVAGITAIAGRDKRTRAQRALDVLRLLRRDAQAPPSEPGSPG